MNRRPNILITNDDGIHAPGIRHLWDSLNQFADLTVIAPATEQSAVGLSITIRDPLRLHQLKWPDETAVWSVTGTPADCIKLGLNVIMDTPPDLVVSGINRGSNAGRNVLYSGTIAAVVEGLMHDIPGIAFSCFEHDNPNYLLATQYVPDVVRYVLTHTLPKGTLLNVNFPRGAKINGFKMAKQGKEFWKENPDMRLHPAENHSYYWLGAKLAIFDEEEDCDISWLRRGYMTAVPIHFDDLTDHQHLDQKKSSFEEWFPSR